MYINHILGIFYFDYKLLDLMIFILEFLIAYLENWAHRTVSYRQNKKDKILIIGAGIIGQGVLILLRYLYGKNINILS